MNGLLRSNFSPLSRVPEAVMDRVELLRDSCEMGRWSVVVLGIQPDIQV